LHLPLFRRYLTYNAVLSVPLVHSTGTFNLAVIGQATWIDSAEGFSNICVSECLPAIGTKPHAFDVLYQIGRGA
jgi:hypothetical protein